MEIVGEAGEIEVLVEAARGHTNEQIASRLYVEEARKRLWVLSEELCREAQN
jgi:hypothetical protein